MCGSERDAKIEDYLDSKGVKWEFIPAVDPGDFDADKSLKNQARFQSIDEARVENYAEAMKRGDQFPPVVAHGKQGKLILADGNPSPGPGALGNSGYRAPPAAPPATAASPLSERVAADFLAGHRGQTRASYASDIRDLFAFAAVLSKPVLLLTRTDLDGYVYDLLERRGLAVSTVRRRLAVTHQLFVWAAEEGVLATNPAGRMRRPRPQNAPARVRLDAGQVRLLLAAAEADSLRAAVMVHLLALHGCRIGEVLAADTTDALGTSISRRLRLLGKGGVVREIVLAGRTALFVERLTDEAGPGPMLRSGTGQRWHRSNAARHLRRLAQTVLEPTVADRVHPHCLRRSWVDLGLSAGVTLGELQFALGHRSPAMVLTYAAQQIPTSGPVSSRVAGAVYADDPRRDAAGAQDFAGEALVAGVEADEGVRHQTPVETVDHQVDLRVFASPSGSRQPAAGAAPTGSCPEVPFIQPVLRDPP